MNYGRCDGGPCDGRNMVHPELEFTVPIETLSGRVRIGMQPGTPGHTYGRYIFEGRKWHWKPSETVG